jgi:phage FluMu protein Com
MRCGKCEKELYACKCVWAIPIVCQRCGEVNPADIHTCTPMTERIIQTSDTTTAESSQPWVKTHRKVEK